MDVTHLVGVLAGRIDLNPGGRELANRHLGLLFSDLKNLCFRATEMVGARLIVRRGSRGLGGLSVPEGLAMR